MRSATDHRATVLRNRKMNTERVLAVSGAGCSSVAGMDFHHPNRKDFVHRLHRVSQITVPDESV
jgi:hypothetical protein